MLEMKLTIIPVSFNLHLSFRILTTDENKNKTWRDRQKEWRQTDGQTDRKPPVTQSSMI